MEETPLNEKYVPRTEFALYCRSVNGDLADLKLGISNLDAKMESRHREVMDHFDTILGQETERRRMDTKDAVGVAKDDTAKALAEAKSDVREALKGTMSKSYAIIITILTGFCMGLLGAVVTLIVTKGKL